MVIIIDDEEIYEVADEVTEEVTETAISRFEMTKAALQRAEAADAEVERQEMLRQAKQDFKKMLSREVGAINTRLEMIQALMERMQ